MIDSPAVSVVVPTGSVDPLLIRQLRAVLAQELDAPFEVIVSLNAPGLVLDPLDESVRHVDSSDRRGAAHARNVGAGAAAAPLLAFCDADDLVHTGWLAALVRAVNDAHAAGGRVLSRTESGEVPRWVPQMQQDDLPRFMGVPYVLSGNMCVRRDAFLAAGGFDETLTRCEDIALSWQLQRRGCQLAFAPDALLTYFMRPSIRSMVKQHYLYGIGMTEVLVRDGRPGDEATGAGVLLRPNNQRGGLGSPVALLRKAAVGAGRLAGLVRERRRPHPRPLP